MEIKLCSICKGEGVTRVGEFTHRSKKLHTRCPKCDGHGRVLSMTWSLEMPFTDKRGTILAANASINKIIKELKAK